MMFSTISCMAMVALAQASTLPATPKFLNFTSGNSTAIGYPTTNVFTGPAALINSTFNPTMTNGTVVTIQWASNSSDFDVYIIGQHAYTYSGINTITLLSEAKNHTQSFQWLVNADEFHIPLPAQFHAEFLNRDGLHPNFVTGNFSIVGADGKEITSSSSPKCGPKFAGVVAVAAGIVGLMLW